MFVGMGSLDLIFEDEIKEKVLQPTASFSDGPQHLFVLGKWITTYSCEFTKNNQVCCCFFLGAPFSFPLNGRLLFAPGLSPFFVLSFS